MDANKELFFNKRATLTRKDLLRFETVLRDALAQFLPFTSYSLYFPQSGATPGLISGKAEYLAEERKVLIPLISSGSILGVFVARGLSLRAPKTMLEMLPKVATLSLDSLLLYKMGITDPRTGLMDEDYFVSRVTQEVKAVQRCLRPGTSGCQDVPAHGYRASLGVVLIHLDSLDWIDDTYGFTFGDTILDSMARIVDRHCPEQGMPARLGRTSLAMLIPEGTPRSCRKIAEELYRDLDELRFEHTMGDRVRCLVSGGYALYPRDMEGAVFERPLPEQARLLLAQAAKAATTAAEVVSINDLRVFGFGRILMEGGRVLDKLPANRLSVSLGRSVNARAGQRFVVWSQSESSAGNPSQTDVPAMYKGEIVLMEVRASRSLAEIIHVGDPTWTIQPGDRLTLATDRKQPARSPEDTPQRDVVSGLLTYRDFMTHLTTEREKHDSFVLSLLLLTGEERTDTSGFQDHAEQLVRSAVDLATPILGDNVQGGRHSLTGLSWFHPNADPEKIAELYTELCERLSSELEVEVAVGLASYPYLNYAKADILDNCRKGLDYALLLPHPRVGLHDSMSITISADKSFSQGNLYDAMEEYKLALMADEDNTLARNSLGIGLARMNRLLEARKCFEAVIERNKRDIMALYNLGYVCQKLGETKTARKYLNNCLRYDKEHVYALIRLGQSWEGERNFAQARKYYNRAAALTEGEGLVRRYLARLSLRQDRVEEAREHLHQALLHDPKDAVCLHLLARLHLDGSEDPEVAEMLAKQAAALRPDQKKYWLTLSRALDARGKTEEAGAARLEASKL